MRRMLVSTLLVSALAAGVAFAQSFSSLEERMTDAEFKAAGLDKLSPQELASLNAWLEREVGRARASGALPAATAAAGTADMRGFREVTDEEGIHSSIAGEFRGWDGKPGERFTLTNGQVWELTSGNGRFKILVNDPEVVIEQGVFNSWTMRVKGYNTRAKVKRVK